jgi:hypothetical protein
LGSRRQDQNQTKSLTPTETVAFAVAEMMRDGEVKQRTPFKIDQMTVTEWIGINIKTFPLPFYASFGLMAAHCVPQSRIGCVNNDQRN